ncbi:hypothetical protein BgiMline_027144 [Biomphalaria glabrata]
MTVSAQTIIVLYGRSVTALRYTFSRLKLSPSWCPPRPATLGETLPLPIRDVATWYKIILVPKPTELVLDFFFKCTEDVGSLFFDRDNLKQYTRFLHLPRVREKQELPGNAGLKS